MPRAAWRIKARRRRERELREGHGVPARVSVAADVVVCFSAWVQLRGECALVCGSTAGASRLARALLVHNHWLQTSCHCNITRDGEVGAARGCLSI